MTVSQTEIGKRQAQVLLAFATIFKEMSVTPNDDFFDLGGDSLLAEALAIRLSGLAGKEVRISALFDHPTPNLMTEFLFSGEPRAPHQHNSRPPIFMVHGASGYTMPKPLFFEGLAADQQLELFQLPGLSGDQPIPDDIPTIAAAYVDQIEQSWPDGRLHIGAFCNGALIAVEMKSQMAKRGRRVDHMVLLDPAVPKTIEAIHTGRTATLTARIIYFLLTGRLTGGISKTDISDRRVRRLWARYHYYEQQLKKLRARLTGHKAHRFPSGQNLWAKSQLHTAVNHYWPDVCTEELDLICSRDRFRKHNDPSGFWRTILPYMRVWSILEKHEDVTGATSSAPAEKMQLLFDQSEGRLASSSTHTEPSESGSLSDVRQ